MGSALLATLRLKSEVDTAIRDTLDKVLVLRFGRAIDAACLHLDDIVSTLSASLLSLRRPSTRAIVELSDNRAKPHAPFPFA